MATRKPQKPKAKPPERTRASGAKPKAKSKPVVSRQSRVRASGRGGRGR